MTPNDSNRARFGPFDVDLHTRELWKFGTKLKLVGQPFQILSVLLSRPGELVTREELRTRLWPADTFVDFNHGLNAAVNKLREALSDSAESPRYIETLPRRGYRFIATLEWVGPKLASAPAMTPAIPPAEVPLDIRVSPAPSLALPAEQPPPRRRWPRFALGAAFLFALLGGGTVLLKTVSGRDAGGRSLPEHTKPLSMLDAFEPAFSPDGNYLAFIGDGADPAGRGVFVTQVGSDQVTRLTRNDDDCCPVWSPDGRWIAFSRVSNKEANLYLVAAEGDAGQKWNTEKRLTPKTAGYVSNVIATASERKLEVNGLIPQHRELDWSPDGKSIAFAGTSGLYLLSIESTAARRITEAPPAAQDWGPAFSPDGQQILFVRNHQLGLPDEIWVTSITGGDGRRILSEKGKIASPPRWSSDGRSVIFSSNRTGHPSLWRASLDSPDSTMAIGQAGSWAWDPAISRRGYRLAYERVTKSLSVWQMDLSAPEGKKPHVLIPATSETDQGPGPQFSPDGEKLAYMSDRSGTMEIWVSNRDGSDPFQLTAVGDAGTPRWSPDSQSIVFDASTTNGSKILTISLRGGGPRILTPDSFHSVCPSWSHDGKWIYFASPRQENWQVWKIPAAGGVPIQITHKGGHAPLESPDGKFIYYAKTPKAEPEVWQVPVDGGEETPVPLVRPGTWASWQVADRGIVFVGPSLGHQAVLSFYDFAHRRTTTIAVLERVPFWLGVTPDGRTAVFDQPGQERAQAMLIENFR